MADLATLSGLTSSASIGQTNSIPAATLPAEQFESVFYSIMIKQLRQTMSESGFFPGEKTDSYGSLFDMYISQHLAEAQPLGFARMIDQYQQTKVE